MEILHSSVKDEHNKGDPVEVVIEVLAIGKSSTIGKGGPFAKSMFSIICSLIPFSSMPTCI